MIHSIPSHTLFSCLILCAYAFIFTLKPFDKELAFINYKISLDLSILIIYCLCKSSRNLAKFIIKNAVYINHNSSIIELLYFNNKIYFGNDINEKIKYINEDKINLIKFPELFLETEEYRFVLAKNTTNKIKEELLEVAMHPDRLESFLSIDEIAMYLKK